MGALNKWSRCMVGLELHRGGVVSKTIFEKRREFFFRGGGGAGGGWIIVRATPFHRPHRAFPKVRE
jgi:hypothetical protein